ncbi:HAMP domain-containing sensor histidine kinase [Microbispora corallina]|uniref:histidine kinase n=1 Tax=Microbispora corallina TaxID=83302 RepID=A0ABQ4FT60_9ACTN|nr:two-component sensor histidine kinase [Microbispora corallina]
MTLADRWPVRTRLAFLTGVTVAVLCILFSAGLMMALHRLATQNLIRETTVAGELIAYSVDRGELVNPLPPVSPNLIRPIQVVDPNGRVVAATRDLQGKPPMANFLPKAPRRNADSEVCDHVFSDHRCDIVVAQQVYRDGGDWTIYSAAPTLPFYVYPPVLILLGGGTVLAVAAVAKGTQRSVRRSLRPVDAIRSELDEIHSTDLGRRVPVPPARDEIHHLARSVNYTLDRLEETLEQQRRFTSDASHELRSPITAIRAQIEDALLAPDEVDMDALGAAVLRSLDRLQSIAADLQTLARLDAGAPCEREPVDLGALVGAELANRRHSRRIVRDLRPGVTVRGDRIRLGRLVTSLLDNAERHASSTVTVIVRRGEDGNPAGDDDPRFRGGVAVVEVLDDGSGIAHDQREVVFQRFTRLDSARSRDAGGAGLGLPIARQIAESHGGALDIRDSPEGARFVLCLPLTP